MIQPEPFDLTNCACEPIHTPGGIQPHGAMLVCESESATVAFTSANVGAVLGIRSVDLLGRPLVEILGEENAHELRNVLTRSGASAAGAALLAVRLPGLPAVFDVIAHRHQDRLIIEFEPAQSRGGAEDSLTVTQTLIRRISLETDVDAIATSAARLVRATLGYDRVMVCRFLHNGAGRVIAESRRPDKHSFLNRHFPAADIPEQARRLYLQNWIRVIADARYESVPLLAAPCARSQPVDMSHAHLRSASPIQCEYLRNMGVVGSLSISIVIDGRLWGLIACHHDSPRTIPLSLRTSAEMFGQYCSLQITVAERRAELHAASEARKRLDLLARSFTPDEAIEVALRNRLRDLAGLIPCDGAALWLDGHWTAIGSVPPPERIQPVIRTLAQQDFGAVWDTHELRSCIAPDTPSDGVAGMLAVPISARARDYLLMFRDDEAHSVTWAGPPEKILTAGPHGLRLTPRGSFDAWREDVRGRAQPWTDAERAVAEAIKTYLRDLVLRHRELLEAERSRTEQRRRILNDELNHRVKNILALVKSIAMQTGAHAANIEEYSAALEGRLRALSYAHDQSLALDSRGDLQALVDAEASLYRYGDGDDRVKVNGPRVGFTETGFSAVALVIHEMMTNATKYGALSTPDGRLSIEWSLNVAGDCELEWTESAGPVVAAPTRKGFGSTLIGSAMTYDLGGTVARDFAPDGLRARFVIPARHVVLVSRCVAPQPPVIAPVSNPLDGLDVLLVEDRALIALDTEGVLYRLGAVAVASYPSVATARQAIAARPPGIVVLDFNLGSETSAALADSLMERHIPFVFLTGYADPATVPSRFGGIPVIRKPLDIDTASQVFATLLQA